MKKSQIAFTVLLVPIDFLMLLLASISAYRSRVGSFVTDIRPVIYNLQFDQYLGYAAIAAIIWLLIFALFGLYNIRSNRKISQELGKIIIGCSIGLLVIVFAIFLQRELFSSRFIILAAWGFAMLYVFLGRTLVLIIQRQFFKRGIASIKIIVIGNDSNTEAIVGEINRQPGHGFKVIKHFPVYNESVRNEILKLNKECFLDEILVADPSINRNTQLEIVQFAEENHLGFRYAADMFNAVATNIKVEPLAGIPLIEVRRTRLEGWGRVFKRLFDIFSALIVIIITSPILILTAIAVKLTSNGPIIFRNERVGQRGQHFDTFKFRSMKSEFSIGKQFEKSDAALKYEQELIKKSDVRKGPLYKIKNDPRYTSIGGFIRKYSIDELPQLFNVLIGDMSLVGPRPHQPREVEKYEKRHLKLLTIKPGITGMAQVSGRSDLKFDDEAKLDMYYIENWSPILDISILLKTPRAVFKNRKVL